MKRVMALIVGLLAGVIIAVALTSDDGDKKKVDPPANNEVLVLCGGSMSASLEAAKKAYEKENPGDVILTSYGGSGELCAQIKLAKPGDVYICHDPFMPWAEKQGLISEWFGIARLGMAIVVPKGNPKELKTLADLAKPGLRLGIGDRTYSTSGQIVNHVLKQAPEGDAIIKNIRIETKGHQARCTDVSLGALDAGLVWDAVASCFTDKLDVIPLKTDDYGPITSATYKESDLENVKVTVGMIAKEKQSDAAKRFYKFMKTRGTAIFVKNGFQPPKE